MERELSHVYFVDGWRTQPDEKGAEPPLITSLQGYESGTYGSTHMPDPGGLERYQRRLDLGQAAGIGHVHPPGFGPAPSMAGDGLDYTVLEMYADAVSKGYWQMQFFNLTAYFADSDLQEKTSPEHLFAAPDPRGGDRMLVGLCHLEPEKQMLVYHPLKLK
jgi:hypothetical protein